MINLGIKLLAELQTTPAVAETLYYIAIYLFKRSEASDIGSELVF